MNTSSHIYHTHQYVRSELSEQQMDDIFKIKMQYWDYPLSSQKNWFNNNIHPKDIHVLTTIENQLVAYLRLTHRRALTENGEIIVMGVTTVCVIKELAGHGIGSEVLSFANRIINSSQNTIGLLQCRYKNSYFYKKCGWHIYDTPIYISKEHLTKEIFQLDECVAMVFPSQVCPEMGIVIIDDRF